ncbi:toll-like receptor 4 [Ostrea edulis]|uniref:toll-like receptor 4 n=1 Tax=Ostrea edulis TaxID=37623 RepID=UPI0024AEFBE7|nr:toll-like receptor 4 [Ostrea edulis]
MAVFQWSFLLCFFISHWISTTAGESYVCTVCKCTSSNNKLKIDCRDRFKSGFNITSFPNNTVWMDLSGNNIKGINWTSPENVSHIDLSRNCISSLHGKPFEGLFFLRYLNLEQNKITFSESNYYLDVFEDLQSLHTLNIKSNTKTSVSAHNIDTAFSKLVSLITLRMDLLFNVTFESGFKNLKNLSRLDVSGITGECNIVYLYQSFFENTPFLKEIDISNCRISDVDKGPFKSLRHLEILDISDNKELGFSSLPNITWGLNMTLIKKFRAEGIHCVIGIGTLLTTSHVENLSQTRLVEISFAHNRIEVIGNGVLSIMPDTLEKLSFALNRLTTGRYLFEFITLHNLTEFNMTLLLKPPKYTTDNFKPCYEKGDSTSQGLSNGVDERQGQGILNYWKPNITVYLPPKFETFYANSSKLHGKIPRIKINATSLKNIYAQNNMLFEWYLPLYGFEKLERLDLSNNFCSRISPHFARSETGLKYVNISRNMLSRSLKADQRCQLFKYQRRIEELDFSSNRLVHIPVCTFQNMARMKILRLNDNQLTDVNIRIRHMINLSFVDLSNNRLSTFADETIEEFNQLFAKTKVLINLKNNKFQCTCENLDFLSWMNQHKHHFLQIEKYVCSDQNNKFDFRKLKESLHELKLQCMNLEMWIVIGCVMITLVICVIAVLIIKKNIWHIRYFLHKNPRAGSGSIYKGLEDESQEPLLVADARNSNAREVSINSENQQGALRYPYDVFISYVGANRKFVMDEVKPRLEENGLKVFIRDIDFEAGDNKIDNIMRALGKSSKTICMVSKPYLKSKWRTYELNMAKMEGMKSRGSLRYVQLILMPDLFEESTSCNTKIRDLIDQKCFLECPPKDSSLQDIFWRDLISTIKSPH